MLKGQRISVKYSKSMRSIFKAMLVCSLGILIGRALLFTLSLPDKYAMTITLCLIAAPLLFLARDKEKLLIGVYLLSLPISMGFKIMEREESTNATVKFLFQLYLSDILLISLVFICFFRTFLNRYSSGNSTQQNKLIIPILLWIGMGFLSLIPAIDQTATFIGIIQMLRIFLTFFCFLHFVNEQKKIHFILNCLLLTLFLQALLMFAQYATNSSVLSFSGATMGLDITDEGMRPCGTMTHSSHFAKFSGLILPICLAYIFFASRFRTKIFMMLIWVCGSTALVLTLSRVGLATWLLSMIIFFSGVIILRIVPARKIIPLFIVCVLWISISAGLLYAVGGQRLKSRVAYDAGSAAARIPMWKVAFNVIKTHPVTGVGLKNYTIVHQDYDHTPEHVSVLLPDEPVHNLFLLYAAEIGVAGLLFFLWFIWELLKGSLRCASHLNTPVDKAVCLGMAIGVLNLFLQSTTGKGVTDHLIHLSVIVIFAACVAKQCSTLDKY